jgi:hypothetical protein
VKISLWRISGVTTSTSSAGTMSVWTWTTDPAIAPDPALALAKADGYEQWAEVLEVVRVIDLPEAWTDLGGNDRMIAMAEAAEGLRSS